MSQLKWHCVSGLSDNLAALEVVRAYSLAKGPLKKKTFNKVHSFLNCLNK